MYIDVVSPPESISVSSNMIYTDIIIIHVKFFEVVVESYAIYQKKNLESHDMQTIETMNDFDV